jgi:hypothetical protein
MKNNIKVTIATNYPSKGVVFFSPQKIPFCRGTKDIGFSAT